MSKAQGAHPPKTLFLGVRYCGKTLAAQESIQNDSLKMKLQTNSCTLSVRSGKFLRKTYQKSVPEISLLFREERL